MNKQILLFVALFVGCVVSIHFPIERKTEVLQLRMKGTENTKSVSAELEGGISLGLYYVTISVGTPPQHFNVQLDTGSADLALPLNTCPTSSCGVHEDPYYDPEASSDSATIPCRYENLDCPICSEDQCSYVIKYLDQSGFSASLYSDTVAIDDFSITQLIGGITDEHSGYYPFEPFAVDGIMGIAYTPISRVDAPTIIDNLVSQTGMKDLFSVCMTLEGGSLSLGEIPSFVESGAIQYTPIVEEHYYTVYITDILVNTQSLGISQFYYNTGGAVVDSGTTDLLLPEEAYHALTKQVTDRCAVEEFVGTCDAVYGQTLFDGYCFRMTEEELEAYPIISIIFNGGVVIDISPTDWIVTGYCDDPALYAIAIDPVPHSYGTVLGDTIMRNRVTVFDREKRRIGFAPVSSCS